MLNLGKFKRINPKQEYNITYTAYLLKNNVLKIGYTRCWCYYGSDLYKLNKNKIIINDEYLNSNKQKIKIIYIYKKEQKSNGTRFNN